MRSEELEVLEKQIRRRILDALIAQGVDSEPVLRLFAMACAGFQIPDVKVCEEHDTPWSYLVHEVLGGGGATIVVANRDGFKTFATALIDFIQAAAFGARVLHMGAVEIQATNGYGYVLDMVRDLGQWACLSNKPKTKEIEFSNRGKIEIAACTVAQANSPRVPHVKVDEMDLADPLALKESKGIPSSDRRGNRASWTAITSRKFADGNLQRALEKAASNNTKVMTWCYKEVTQRCPDEKSGTKAVPVYISMRDLEWMTEATYREKETSLEVEGLDGYDRFSVFDGCLSCGILPTCRGDLKRAGGVLPIHDLEGLFGEWDTDDWISQKECRDIPSAGRIYRKFQAWRNVCSFPVQDGERFWTGKDGLPIGRIFWGIDFGYEHPSVISVCQRTLGRCGHYHLWVLDEFYVRHKTEDEIIDQLEKRRWIEVERKETRDSKGRKRVKKRVLPLNESKPGTLYGKPDVIFADPTSPKSIKVWRMSGFRVQARRHEIVDGIKEVRKTIAPANCNEAHIHFHPRCKRLISDHNRYSFKLDRHGKPTEVPSKGGPEAPDHGTDNIRMVVWGSMRKTSKWYEALSDNESGQHQKKNS